MYFLRIRPLKDQLAREGLAEVDRFRYLLAWMLLVTLSSVSGGVHSSIVVFLLFVITVLGVVWAWRRNGGREGHALLDRYFSLGFVVNLRVMLVLLVFMGVMDLLPALQEALDQMGTLLGYFGGGVTTDESVGQPWTDLVGLVAEAWIAWSIGRHVGQVRATAEGGAGGSAASGRGVAPAAPYPIAPAEGGPAGLRRGSVDRVVERLVQSEIQAGTAIPAAKRRPRRPAIRTVRSLRTRRSRKAR